MPLLSHSENDAPKIEGTYIVFLESERPHTKQAAGSTAKAIWGLIMLSVYTLLNPKGK